MGCKERAALGGGQCDRGSSTGIARGACQHAPVASDDQQAVAGKKLRLNLEVVTGAHCPRAFGSRLEVEDADRVDLGRARLVRSCTSGHRHDG